LDETKTGEGEEPFNYGVRKNELEAYTLRPRRRSTLDRGGFINGGKTRHISKRKGGGAESQEFLTIPSEKKKRDLKRGISFRKKKRESLLRASLDKKNFHKISFGGCRGRVVEARNPLQPLLAAHLFRRKRRREPGTERGGVLKREK